MGKPLSEQGEFMKKLSVIFGLFLLALAELAFANARVTTVSGTVSAAVGAGPSRTLRQGDTVKQGETVVTGENSSAVLLFDDGQITALTANARLTVTTYTYNPQSGSGNILLSLVSGGMRAITGLIGKNNPQQVAYRAATATIGIRGTDVTVVLNRDGSYVVTVTEGSISFTVAGQTAVV